MVETSSFASSKSGEVGVLLYRATLLPSWDNPPSHDQTRYNISMMVLLDLYNRGNNALTICNCNISVVHDLFLVPFHLNLIRTLEIQCIPSLHFDRGPMFRFELCR